MAEIVTKDVEQAITHLMWDFGPDGHSDGSDVLALFVEGLISGLSVPDAEERAWKWGKEHWR